MPEERPPALRRLGKLPKCCEMPRKELSPPASPCNDCSGAFVITEKTSIDCETKAVLPSSCNVPLAFLGGKASEVLRPRTERGSEQEGAKVWKLKPATEILTDKKLLFSSVQAKALGRSPEAVLGCPQPPPPSLCKLCVNKSKRVFCWDKGDTTSYPASYTVHQASGQAAGSQEPREPLVAALCSAAVTELLYLCRYLDCLLSAVLGIRSGTAASNTCKPCLQNLRFQVRLPIPI